MFMSRIKEYIDSDKIISIVKNLCELIEENDTNIDVIEKLSLVLRLKEIEDKEKNEIIALLMMYSNNSKKLRAKNIFLNEAEILEKKIILKSKPRRMVVSITNRCNLRCLMCGQHFEQQYDIGENAYNFVRNTIPYLEEVKWQGGEVFLFNKFNELVELCNKYKVYQLIATNGLLINEKNIKLFLGDNIHLHFSIDAVDKETYERIRVGANYNSLLNSLELVKKYVRKENKIMAFVVMNLNYKQIKEAIYFAINYGFGMIKFQRIIAFDFCENLELSKEQEKEAIKTIEYYQRQSREGIINIEIESDLSLDFCNDCDKNNVDYNDKNADCSNKVDSNVSVQNKKLYCIAPWTTLCIFNNDTIRFACSGSEVSVEQDLWNAEDINKYRKQIVNNDLSCCNSTCSTRGFEAIKTKIGL